MMGSAALVYEDHRFFLALEEALKKLAKFRIFSFSAFFYSASLTSPNGLDRSTSKPLIVIHKSIYLPRRRRLKKVKDTVV